VKQEVMVNASPAPVSAGLFWLRQQFRMLYNQHAAKAITI